MLINIRVYVYVYAVQRLILASVLHNYSSILHTWHIISWVHVFKPVWYVVSGSTYTLIIKFCMHFVILSFYIKKLTILSEIKISSKNEAYLFNSSFTCQQHSKSIHHWVNKCMNSNKRVFFNTCDSTWSLKIRINPFCLKKRSR